MKCLTDTRPFLASVDLKITTARLLLWAARNIAPAKANRLTLTQSYCDAGGFSIAKSPMLESKVPFSSHWFGDKLGVLPNQI